MPVIFPRAVRLVALAVIASLVSACTGAGGGGGGGGGGNPPPTIAPTNYYACPTADSTTSVVTGGSARSEGAIRIAPRRTNGTSEQQYAPGLLAVIYNGGYAATQARAITSRESLLGAQNVRVLDYRSIGEVEHVIAIDPSRVGIAESALRGQAGVLSVSRVAFRHTLEVTTPYFPNNPYFDGFVGTTAPYYETSTIPGEWDAHATGLEYAFGYSQSGNGSGIVNANALGSPSIAIAMIDTGQDTAHPELAGKIVRQRCYITDPNGVQSRSDFTTDPQGHGTDTAGIAADALNTGLGFAGEGGNVSLFGYRVFPTPDSDAACGSNPPAHDYTCQATTADIADAIDDAVNNGANVISISLGGGTCSGGVDPDPTEGAAITYALSHNVIVVAASGNGGASTVDSPACDTGVIAVGATSLDDGTPNGASGSGGNAGGTPSSPAEYVASYSNSGPSCAIRSSSCWGIVAPGGDPTGSSDMDDLHWIENIWTSNADNYDPTNNGGNCGSDYGTISGPSDCRILIAGTSMSTPRVAGAAALLLSVKPSLQSPSLMKAALCNYADDISDPAQGCGRLNVYTSMAHAVGDPSPPPPIP